MIVAGDSDVRRRLELPRRERRDGSRRDVLGRARAVVRRFRGDDNELRRNQ